MDWCVWPMIQFEYRNDPKFWTDRSGQTVQTQIRLLLEEQSAVWCLLFNLDLLIPYGLASLFEFKVDYSKVSLCPKI